MAITSSAKKAIRSAARKRVFNLARQKALREAIKEFTKLVAAKDQKGANAKLASVYQAIDKAAKRGLIKAANAARQKSRFARLLKQAV